VIITALLAASLFAQTPSDRPPLPLAPASAAPSTAAAQPGSARGRQPAGATPAAPDRAPSAEKPKDPADDDTPVVTRHQITLNGKPLKYTATAGMMPLKSDTGEVDARIFYVAYTLDDSESTRPLTFAFNGGPGSSAVWLHMGALGPRRVKLLDNGGMPPPPFQVVDNEDTWLDDTDLVFIDPVGTGFSHAAKPEDNRKYWGVQPDLNSMEQFVRLYVARNERWSSPLFVAGESYGTFRAAGLAGALNDDGIALNGVILISTILKMGGGADDMSSVLNLPTYAATAWYHKKLPADLQSRPLGSLLPEVEAWALGDYNASLVQGDRLPAARRDKVVSTLSRYTGLARSYVDDANLRISDSRFYKELLRDRKRTVGRFDTRVLGVDPDAAGERADYDPSETAVTPPFTMAFNQYVRSELGFKSDRQYGILVPIPWDFGSGMGGFGRRNGADTSGALRDAMTQNPYLKVFVAEGHYDLATPYFAVEDTLSHMRLDEEARGRISSAQYDAGHMVYTDAPSRHKLKADVSRFLRNAASPALSPGQPAR
jgi:carboxypeptidase C (cathepsin A)